MISVIVTGYAQSESLEILLRCLSVQVMDENFEVLVCDDGSSPAMIAESYATYIHLGLDLRYIWQTKQGNRAARSKNNGIRCAAGELLVFLDGDIVVREDFLREHRAAHAKEKQIVCNARKWFLGSGQQPMPAGLAECTGTQPRFTNLKELSVKNPRELFSYLDAHSFNVDRDGQKAASLSDCPWAACIGFSFSVAKTDSLYFDEGFVGWGPEDRELALRMVKRHGYEIVFCDDIEVFHLEDYSTGRQPGRLFPQDSAAATQYLENMCYFDNLYPDEDLSAVLAPILGYRLNTPGDSWESTPISDIRSGEPLDIETQLARIRSWIARTKRSGACH
jgi:cellulose synthase/poly-beta-1,6-N-acetylglucosamine synthase-like glycosyltransferase